MVLRTLFAAMLVGGVFTLGCSSDKKDDEAPQGTPDKNQANADGTDTPKQPAATSTAAREDFGEFSVEKWAPDPGQANPDAWRPEESEIGKATESVFGAFGRALRGGDENQP